MLNNHSDTCKEAKKKSVEIKECALWLKTSSSRMESKD